MKFIKHDIQRSSIYRGLKCVYNREGTIHVTYIISNGGNVGAFAHRIIKSPTNKMDENIIVIFSLKNTVNIIYNIFSIKVGKKDGLSNSVRSCYNKYF